jgi:hypothetical protein
MFEKYQLRCHAPETNEQNGHQDSTESREGRFSHVLQSILTYG